MQAEYVPEGTGRTGAAFLLAEGVWDYLRFRISRISEEGDQTVDVDHQCNVAHLVQSVAEAVVRTIMVRDSPQGLAVFTGSVTTARETQERQKCVTVCHRVPKHGAEGDGLPSGGKRLNHGIHGRARKEDWTTNRTN